MSTDIISLRIDKCQQDVTAWIESRGYGGFAVEENNVNGNNLHWHYLVVGNEINVQSFRVMLTRAVKELKGNGSYAVSPVRDLDHYERYMCKGEAKGKMPIIVWRMSLKYTDEFIQLLHERYWETSQKIKNIDDTVYRLCIEKGVSWNDRENIVVIYLRQLVASNRRINEFAVKAAVNLIQCRLSPNEDYLHVLKERI